ncbi:MAG: peptide chain release factor N(5)-glutamine methyltransferase [Hyphomicrobiales bacterium]|nr:MAG: peptide chain release factor N(5)-glutamine methyltransferase [Hyphomicrobiales bacterium]
MTTPGDPHPPRDATVASVQMRVARALAEAGIAQAGDEARRLMAVALGWSAADLVSRSRDALDQAAQNAVAHILERRLRHEPLSRIVGYREFYGRNFKVTPATLDPRADTETLIDAALQTFADERAKPLRILDIGTGTGAIILTLLCEFPNATGVAADISDTALEVARENAQTLGVSARIDFVKTDLAEGVSGPFDLVVSNPPYIPSGDIAGLDVSVRAFDPTLALDGGPDGLAVYRRLTKLLPVLAPKGTILLEVGFNQWEAVAQTVEAGYAGSGGTVALQAFNDVAGIRRVVAARPRTAG